MAMPRLEWNEVVGQAQTVADGGFVGDLLTIARAHIDDAQSKGKLTQSDAAKIYTQMIPAAFQDAIQYSLGRANANIDIALKEDQLTLQRDKTEAELEKNFGYEVTRDNDGSLILGVSTGNGKIDKDIEISQSEVNLKEDSFYLNRSKVRAELEKNWGYDVDTDQDGRLFLAQNLHNGKIDKDIEISEAEIDIKEDQLSNSRNKTYAELEKNFGYNVAIDSVTGRLVLGSSTGKGKIDKDIENAENEIKLREDQIEAARNKTEAELEKTWGYYVTRDINGKPILGNSNGTGKVDKEIGLAAQQILTEVENTALRVEQVGAFDDNRKQKLFESSMNAWALMYSSGQLTTITDPVTGVITDAVPEFINNDDMSRLYSEIYPAS